MAVDPSLTENTVAVGGDDSVALPPAAAKPASYRVTVADAEADAGTVQALWQRNLPEAPAQRYDWLYLSGMADGWLLETSGGEPIGSAGLMHRRMRLVGHDCRCGQAVDLNVDREHRFAAPALKLQRAVTSTVRDGRFDLIYAFANAQSTPLLRRVGYRPMGELQRWVKPLRLGPRLCQRHQGGPTRKLATRIAMPLVRLTSPETYRYPDRLRRIKVVEQFDQRFDELWATSSGRWGIAGERTAEYLDWRFLHCPGAGHRILVLENFEGDLQAYIVYRRRESFAYLADFFSGSRKALRLLMAGFLRRMRRTGIEAVVALWFGAADVTQTLRHFGFWRRPSGLNTLVYADDARLGVARDTLLDRQQWFLTAADFDFDVE